MFVKKIATRRFLCLSAIIYFLFSTIVSAQPNTSSALQISGGDPGNYSLSIQQFWLKDSEEIRSKLRALIEKGYFVYIERVSRRRPRSATWVSRDSLLKLSPDKRREFMETERKKRRELMQAERKKLKEIPDAVIKVGLFETVAEANSFGIEFKRKEGYDYTIEPAVIQVMRLDSGKKLAVAGGNIWLLDNNSADLIYNSDSGKGIFSLRSNNTDQVIRPSPDKSSILIYNDYKFFMLKPQNSRPYLLLENVPTAFENLVNSNPRWSPSGKYIGFMDALDFETTTRIWVISANGLELKCLFPGRGRDKFAKGFQWHPENDTIFFIEGYAYGTTSPGGDLYSVDLDGNISLVLRADTSKRHQILPGFKIEDGILKYTIMEYDEEYMKRTFIERELPLKEIK